MATYQEGSGKEETAKNYQNFNQNAWSYLVRQREASTRPYGPIEFRNARFWLDPSSWIPWRQVHRVLCLAAGGGQQGPLFASLGLDVTVFDLNAEQLRTDRRAARRHGLTINCIQGDMMDLSALHGSNFDLVYQPISSLYVPDIRPVYREVLKVLRPRGYYWVEHWNPAQMQVAESNRWDGEGYRIVHRQGTGQPLAWEHATGNGESAVSWNYIHSLESLIGGICDAGMVILKFGERHDGNPWAKPGSNPHLAAYIPSFYSIFARRPSRRLKPLSRKET
jgi:SAM-dependent methyltransferase